MGPNHFSSTAEPAMLPTERPATLPSFGTESAFELLQRQANALTQSGMVPPLYRRWRVDGTENREALPNTLIALNMAMRLHADPLMTMQNLIVIQGNPGWSARFLIGLFNTCGRFSAIRYRFNEEQTACRAYCAELSTGEEIEGPAASIAMSKAEGWFDRKGSKWRTMPEIMLRNRAAAFLIRTTAPELSLGLPMADELLDRGIIENEPPAVPPIERVRAAMRQSAAPFAEAIVPMRERTPAEERAYALNIEPAPIHGRIEEPQDLPVKDGESESEAVPAREREPADASDTRDARARPAKPAKPASADTRALVPFDVEAYAARIEATADIDVLIVMRDDIAIAPADTPGRDELLERIDAKARELIPEID